ncbi:hypothetical protein [Sphingomonas sp.]|uniref:hypothetical protein n=1 Tax=Sphingomonas sp. TaxID=28214 RepID=UPI001EC08FD6|nr:hypothetical protein [Sphingomonas sp.]MBX3595065.1 hypothetical protein [Sphingomonas sp.]
MNKTLHELRHIERLSRSLYSILGDELGAPVPLKVCCATVAAGLALQQDRRILPKGYWFGLPWNTNAALYFLAGRGFVFDPPLALEALERLEERHIIDRRRMRWVSRDENSLLHNQRLVETSR